MIDSLLHRYLRIPYTLSVHDYVRQRGARQTIVLLHGVGATGKSWDRVIQNIAKDKVNIITLDLLGFGNSPRPDWATYDVATQARAVAKTLAFHRITTKVTLVGHSMGSLVAVECARRYKYLIRSLVLCSPPLYSARPSGKIPDRDAMLKKAYELAALHPKQLIQGYAMAQKYHLVGEGYDVSTETIDAYIAALRNSIISQTSLEDLAQMKLPVHILYGTLDPFVIGRHIKRLVKNHSNITAESFVGGHEIDKRYALLVSAAVKKIV